MAEGQTEETTTPTAGRVRLVEWVFINLHFVCYLALLGIIYIWNAHYSERTLRRIEKEKREVMDYKSQYMDLQQELRAGSTQSQLAKNLQDQNIKPLSSPARKLVIPADKDNK